MIALIGQRLAASIALLALLTLLYAVLPPTGYVLVITAAIVATVLVQVAAFVFFSRRAIAQPEIFALQIRAKDAFVLFVASLVVAVMIVVIALRVLEAIPASDAVRAVFAIGLAFGLLMLAGPAANWLVIWRPWRGE